MCCSVLQCVAVCCSALQCMTVCNQLLFRTRHLVVLNTLLLPLVLQCVAVCCSVLQCVAVCCSVTATYSNEFGISGFKTLSFFRVSSTHRNTLQQTATHCNTLRHTATHCNTLHRNHSTLFVHELSHIFCVCVCVCVCACMCACMYIYVCAQK